MPKSFYYVSIDKVDEGEYMKVCCFHADFANRFNNPIDVWSDRCTTVENVTNGCILYRGDLLFVYQ